MAGVAATVLLELLSGKSLTSLFGVHYWRRDDASVVSQITKILFEQFYRAYVQWMW
jgi:hypothetical protein